MKYLKITVVLFALIIGLYACGSRTENPKPSFQSKDTIAPQKRILLRQPQMKAIITFRLMTLYLTVLKSGVKKSNLCTMHYMSLPRKQCQTVHGTIPACPKAVSIP